jgi:hypothetical protein
MREQPLLILGPGGAYRQRIEEDHVPRFSLLLTLVAVALSAASVGGAITAWVLW